LSNTDSDLSAIIIPPNLCDDIFIYNIYVIYTHTYIGLFIKLYFSVNKRKLLFKKVSVTEDQNDDNLILKIHHT
jgi:hypothetical protein